jgi:prolyl oligopeptidase
MIAIHQSGACMTHKALPTLGRAAVAAATVLTAFLAAPRVRSADSRPPETRVAPVEETLHGVTLTDPYRWLEDQAAPETRAWIDAENAYTESVIGPIPGKDRIERRLTELIKIDIVSVPFTRGGRQFYSRRRADQEQAILYVKKGDGPEEVLVDPHGLSPDHSASANFQDVSPDGRLLAYGVRQGGQDEVEVRLMDVDSRQALESLPKARYSGVAIAADKASLYYSRVTPEGPRVYRHRIGGAQMDEELFGSGYGPEKIIGAELSGDGRYLLVSVLHGSAATKTELYVQEIGKGTPLRPVVNDVDAVFSGEIGGDTLFLRTNWKAPNSRVMAVDLHDPSPSTRERWREIVPEGKSPINAIRVAGGQLFVTRIEDVQPRVQAYTPAGKAVRDVPLPGIGSTTGINGAWDQDEAFFQFSSLSQPQTIYRYRVSSGATDVWARLDVPVGKDGVEVRQVFFTSKDGTRVPMFVAHRKGLTLDGKRPTLLTAYGGFNQPQLPAFSARATFWIENGGVYALANLRGGGEYGEAWHHAGMLEKKQNVFDDFIAAAEWLVSAKYASPETLAISGGSNGGLLVGAAMTQRPELFRAVVCSYPLLDMVRYHRFLVARYWVPEYGSSDDPGQLGFLRAYSPYHNVKKGVRYPAVLFITGDGDTRVAPLHARKMAALMQASTGSGPDRPVLLHYDTKAGHSGGLPASKQIEDLTQEMQFLFWQLGVS